MKQACAAMLLLTVLLTGCARPRAEKPPDRAPEQFPRPVITQKEPLSVAEQMAGQEGVISVLITDRGFEPQEVPTAVGGRVKIHLKNASGGKHNLVVQRFGIVSRTLAPGEENYIEFTPSETGEWPVVSDAPGAVEPGFTATLKVE
ncbi:MAG TPA: cupredoxin domain-containing protein [Symbiobacteriaceae bacterium]|nr:cupredoxin domain-containing protein [Symbiobacteriaceae bacterium]